MEGEDSFCFICCGAAISKVDEKNNCWEKSDRSASRMEDNLEAIFILKNLLKVPSILLERQLRESGDNPEDWIRLCDQCTHLTGKARKLEREIKKFERHLKLIEKEVLEKISLTDDDEQEGDSNGEVHSFPRKIRLFIKQSE